MSLHAASQMLNKTKNIFEIKNITWECKQQISVGGAIRKEILSSQYDRSIVFWRKKQITLARAHNRDTLPLTSSIASIVIAGPVLSLQALKKAKFVP